jgi:hypothetical protein
MENIVPNPLGDHRAKTHAGERQLVYILIIQRRPVLVASGTDEEILKNEFG